MVRRLAQWMVVVAGAVLAGCGERSPAPAVGPWRHGTVVHDWPDAADRPVATPDRPYVTPGLIVPGGFSQVLASWNVDVAEGAGAALEIRVGDGVNAWSPWFTITTWSPGDGDANGGDPPPAPDPDPAAANAGDWGKVNIDFFTSKRSYEQVQARVRVRGGKATLRRIALCTTGTGSAPVTGPAPAAFAAEVPFRTQKTPDKALSGRLCSPTSVAMAIARQDPSIETRTVADCVYDTPHDIYGNWPRNVQGAWTLGLPGVLTRFSSWPEVAATLDTGRLIVMSIDFKESELRGAGFTSNGHLVVIHGFDERGDVRVQDPARGTAEEGRRVFNRDDLTRVWLQRNRGTAYVFDAVATP